MSEATNPLVVMWDLLHAVHACAVAQTTWEGYQSFQPVLDMITKLQVIMIARADYETIRESLDYHVRVYGREDGK